MAIRLRMTGRRCSQTSQTLLRIVGDAPSPVLNAPQCPALKLKNTTLVSYEDLII